MFWPTWTQIFASLGAVSSLYMVYKIFKHIFPKNPCVFERNTVFTSGYKGEVPVLCGMSYNKEVKGSASPFVGKVETYLRMAGIPFKVHKTANLMESPTGKIPFMLHRGKIICDSSEIIEYLKREYPMKSPGGDQEMTSKRHMLIALQRMVEDHLYWLIVFYRWGTNAGEKWVNREFFKFIPAFIRPFIAPNIVYTVRKNLVGVGVGRYTSDTRFKKLQEDLLTLQDILGDKQYMLTENLPSTADAIVYPFLANALDLPKGDHEKVTQFMQKATPKLIQYVHRIKSHYYAEAHERVNVPVKA
mmetsp:Transcript_9189/g.13599  ORF Transcript_9189/g.13599 Transcript_9189/m.13599 type:complete len:302 (+) Transcript_9189:21-926(+)